MRPSIMSVWRFGLTLVVSAGLFVASVLATPQALPGSSAVPGLMRFQAADGAAYAALILPAPAVPKIQSTPHDHVVIVDTSASQNGDYRTRSIAVAAEVCRRLPTGDRVRLVATDTTSEALSDFVPVGSAELQAGFDRLEERVPLGSSNLELALRTAKEKFSGNRARSILYIGDGFSTAELIQFAPLRELVTGLRKAGIPVNSFAIGPRVDLILLGTLAQHTGGIVVIDEPGEVAANSGATGDLAEVAQRLVRAAVTPVFYPTSLKTSPAIPSLLPQMLPPVRFDRETVLLGKNLAGSQVQVKMTGTIQGQNKELTWMLSDEKVDGSAGFVAQAWAIAEASEGMSMPWAGRKLLVRGHQIFQAQLENLAENGSKSLREKNVRQVEQIVQALQQLDPNNSDAAHLKQAAQRIKAKPISRKRVLAQAEEKEEKAAEAKTAEEPKPTEEPAAEEKPAEDKPAEEKASEDKPADEKPADEKPADAVPAPVAPAETTSTDEKDTSDPKSDSLIEELEAKRTVREQQLTIDVNSAIDLAKQGARESYLDAQDILKRQLDSVIAATDISGDVRQALRKRVEGAIQELTNNNELYEQQRAGLDRRLSQEEAMKKIKEQAWRDEEKMQQLIDRVRALMVRGFKGAEQAFEDGEAVSRVAVELDPYNGVPNLDVFNTEAAGALDKARRLRSLRADKLLAVLHQVELSHVPFPDEPPILWPSPERWQWITENRRKWKSVDLKAYSKKEEKIVQELDKPTTFDFTDESLDGVRETIMERHGFDIVLDKVKLEEESVATDATDITLKVQEISLKNALKLLLDTKNLTYSIENEVMKITTKTEGATKRPLRVYQVGDLTMPINPLRGMGGMGGGMMGGGMGGMGGGMGGMGGGMMGGGGMGMGGMGMGGMGMGGMGGGMFNIPPVKAQAQPNNGGVPLPAFQGN